MAFCNLNCGCGKSCGRQDDHGGGCDCYEKGCITWALALPNVQSPSSLNLYAIRNDKKEWFRTATPGHPPAWVKDLADARIYAKLSSARSKVTAWANEHKKSPVPALVELVVTEQRIVDQQDRLAEVRRKKQLEIEERKQVQARQQLENAKRDLAEAQARVMRLQGVRIHATDCACKSCVGM